METVKLLNENKYIDIISFEFEIDWVYIRRNRYVRGKAFR